MKKLLILALMLTSFNAFAKTEYTKVTLENGLEAYLIQDHRQPIAINMVWYKVGSADEIPGKSGIAHLHEHLMFKGTDKIAPQEFSKKIARLGGVDNASTSFDYTNYYQMINVQNLDTAMSMEADRMKNLKLSEQDFQTERKVVIQERKQRIDNSPWGRFYEKIMAELYTTMPYKIITTGTLKDLDNLERQDSLDWYKKYYAPNNAIVLIVGDLQPDEFKKLVTKNFAKLEPSNVELTDWATEPLYEKPKRLVVEDKQVKSPNYFKIYRVPSFFAGVAGEKTNSDEVANLIVLSQLLGGSKTSYLYEKIVLNQDIANSISIDYSPISRAETTFDFTVQVKDETKQGTMEKALEFAIDQFINEFDDQEKLDIAKTTIKASQIYAKDDAMSFARSIGKLLSDGGSIQMYDDYFKHLDAVTLDSLKQTAKKYLQSNQTMDAWLLPIKKD